MAVLYSEFYLICVWIIAVQEDSDTESGLKQSLPAKVYHTGSQSKDQPSKKTARGRQKRCPGKRDQEEPGELEQLGKKKRQDCLTPGTKTELAPRQGNTIHWGRTDTEGQVKLIVMGRKITQAGEVSDTRYQRGEFQSKIQKGMNG